MATALHPRQADLYVTIRDMFKPGEALFLDEIEQYLHNKRVRFFHSQLDDALERLVQEKYLGFVVLRRRTIFVKNGYRPRYYRPGGHEYD